MSCFRGAWKALWCSRALTRHSLHGFLFTVSDIVAGTIHPYRFHLAASVRAFTLRPGELRCAKLVTHRGAVIDAQVRVVSDGEEQGDEKSPYGVAIVQNARASSVRPWTRRHIRRGLPVVGGAALSLCFVAVGAMIF